jgi:hypothetical protein
MADGQGPGPFEPRLPMDERRRSAVSKRYNECVRSAYEKLGHRRGGDWGISHAGKDREAQEIGQSAALHTKHHYTGRNEYGSQAV